MTLRLTDLLADGLRMMMRLDDGQPHADSVGLRADELRPQDLAPVGRLMAMGLAERVLGWRGMTTYRLTERGRKLRDEGEAD